MTFADKLEIVNVSDVGRRRPHNEDSTLSDIEQGLVVLADGMGGYKAGEVASAIAVTTSHDQINLGLKKIKRGQTDKKTGLRSESDLVKEAIIQANSNIYNSAQSDPECQGMGTTIVVALFYDGIVTIAHVGDSRLYRKRAQNFEQVTKDHSLIQELIDRGLYTPEEAHAKTPKNLVTRALGIDAKVEVDVMEEPVLAGDIFLLCSDGLNDMVDDEEIHLTLSKYSVNLPEAAQALVSLANAKGGKDNISVILIRALEGFSNSGGFMKQLINRFR
jgi:PPM family protein phosphatase